MSETPLQPADSNPSDDQALSALKRMARPQPKHVGEPLPPSPEASGGSGSATGFVGTLGKPPGTPQPGDSVAGTPGLKSKNTLGMAREVPNRSLSQLAQAARDAATENEAKPFEPAGPPSASATAGVMPYLMMGLALILLIIGSWAVGALMYMKISQPMSPRDVNYPFLVWHIDLHTSGSYTPATYAMAWSMLLCLPVATLLLILGWRLRKPRS
jgi:hypothetical protein